MKRTANASRQAGTNEKELTADSTRLTDTRHLKPLSILSWLYLKLVQIITKTAKRKWYCLQGLKVVSRKKRSSPKAIPQFHHSHVRARTRIPSPSISPSLADVVGCDRNSDLHPPADDLHSLEGMRSIRIATKDWKVPRQ